MSGKLQWRRSDDRHPGVKTHCNSGAICCLLAVFVYLLAIRPVHADQNAANARVSKTIITIDRAIASSSVPGIVVGITDRKQIQSVVTHGYADLKRKTLLTPNSLFAIGSISKSFTAVALMELRDQGRFDPQVPVKQYLPWFELNSPFPPITGHHLLSHTSGLPLYRADLSSSRYVTLALREFEPAYAPGTHYWYSDIGFQILGYVTESVAGVPYHTLIERKILAPLAMTASFALVDDSLRAKLPISYVRWPYDDKYVESPWFAYTAADGSVVSTAADMCAYARFILNRGATAHGRLISEKSFELLTTPVLEGYAYGLRVRQADGDTIIGHSGGIAGFESHLEAHMNDGFAVVLLSNGGLDPALTGWIVSALTAAYRNEPPPEPPAPSIGTHDAGQYAGIYRAPDGAALEFAAADDQLLLKQGDAVLALARMGKDSFRMPLDNSDSYPFIFGRDGAHEGDRVVEVSHGAQWYANDHYVGARQATPPPEYLAYVGHYENHNPEGPTARIFVRGSRLAALIDGEVPSTSAQVLEPVRRGLFRPAEPAFNPERYVFDTVLQGHALRLLISGAPLYRLDTP